LLLTLFASAQSGKENVNALAMFLALVLAATVPSAPQPPRFTVVARARILRGTRINFRDPARKPEGAIIRKGLIEFH
jgi:hypothetical protein